MGGRAAWAGSLKAPISAQGAGTIENPSPLLSPCRQGMSLVQSRQARGSPDAESDLQLPGVRRCRIPRATFRDAVAPGVADTLLADDSAPPSCSPSASGRPRAPEPGRQRLIPQHPPARAAACSETSTNGAPVALASLIARNSIQSSAPGR
jgi:hypothetical protein